jgi:hypothetical protein
MSHEDNLNPADREFEDALRSLSPTTTTRIDPIAAAFQAGARSTRRTTRIWQSLAAILLIGWLGASILPRSPRSAPSVNFVEAVQPPVAQPLSAQSVLALQETVRHHGIDALPRTAVPAIHEFDAKDLF